MITFPTATLLRWLLGGFLLDGFVRVKGIQGRYVPILKED